MKPSAKAFAKRIHLRAAGQINRLYSNIAFPPIFVFFYAETDAIAHFSNLTMCRYCTGRYVCVLGHFLPGSRLVGPIILRYNPIVDTLAGIRRVPVAQEWGLSMLGLP